MRRPPTTVPRPRIQRRWFVIGAIVLLLFISISSIVRFYTDLLWFQELHFAAVFWKILWTRIGVGVIGGLGATLIVFLNLEIPRRSAPAYRFVTAGSDIAEQYRSAFRPYARLANIGISLLVGFFTGLSSSAIWDRYLLWKNAKPFGVKAPAPFGHDVSYYVFTLPFQRAIISWLFGIVIVSLLLAGLAHLFNGSIQPEQSRVRVATAVKVHVSVLLGILALLKAWAYWLDKYELVYSGRGKVNGASYTDVHAQLPALRLLFVIAIIAAVIFLVNVFRFQGWLLPATAAGLWAFSSIVLGAVYPAIVQRFQVIPNESTRESPYIQRNIDETRKAFGLDRIKQSDFPANSDLSDNDVANNAGTVDNVRIWDPSVLQPTYQRLQSFRTYYDFDDVDIDRYDVDGKLTQVMVSGREVDATKLPGAESWVNQRLSYTHGYGIVASPANAVSAEGLPKLLVSGLPPDGEKDFVANRPGLYYGERLSEYSVANTKQKEIDYARNDRDVTTSYGGRGGIKLSSMIRRLAFAIRFGDTDLAISNFIKPDSKLIMRRNIVERVQAAAPFLQFDHDPYLVSAGGRYQWILDAYTTTDRFPYSQRIDLDTALAGSLNHAHGVANYMRNSVKAVVDAYDGTTTFYLMDPSDALAATYQAAFPTLFKAADTMPKDLRAHLRYPEDLFKVQAQQYQSYHITQAQRLYAREDVWDLPVDPVKSSGTANVPMDPYYVVMKLPGEKHEEFVLMLPFTPKGRQLLNGWVAARMDPGHYGELVGFQFPRQKQIDGPENIAGRIEQNEVISRQFTLWEGAGSAVERGNMLVLPIGKSLMYVQPIYLKAQEEARALPELRRVIVVIGNSIGFESTFQASLDAALKGRGPTLEPGSGVTPPPTTPSTSPSPSSRPSGTTAELLRQAQDHFQRADDALRNGDLATYQREEQAGRAAVEEAAKSSEG